MRKFSFLPLALLLLFFSPAAAFADSAPAEIGYTKEGLLYEVHNLSCLSYLDDSIFITKEIIYQGNALPQLELSWTETIKGAQYSGTLYLVKFTYYSDRNQTAAVYEGTLTR